MQKEIDPKTFHKFFRGFSAGLFFEICAKPLLVCERRQIRQINALCHILLHNETLVIT